MLEFLLEPGTAFGVFSLLLVGGTFALCALIEKEG